MCNKIILLGRLVKDVECRYTQQGKCVASFTLAVNRPFKGADGNYEADFIPVVLWDKTADVVYRHVHKGQRLLVEGRLQIRTYDAQDGSKRWVTEVVGSSVEFIEKKEQSGDNGGSFESMGQAVPFDSEIPF